MGKKGEFIIRREEALGVRKQVKKTKETSQICQARVWALKGDAVRGP